MTFQQARDHLSWDSRCSRCETCLEAWRIIGAEENKKIRETAGTIDIDSVDDAGIPFLK